ncbi:MAG: winged helix-turn-helix transcriptional regulator [Nitrososphaeraceae archaeon]
MTIKDKEIYPKILEHIRTDPGVRYRKLLRLTGLSNGSLSYTLKKLEKSRRVIVNRSSNSRVTSYYPKNIKTTELQILANLRNNTERRIVQFLLKQGQSTFNDIVNHAEKAPSTISWHLNRLRIRKLITTNRQHIRPRTYKLINKNNVARIVSKYK